MFKISLLILALGTCSLGFPAKLDGLARSQRHQRKGTGKIDVPSAEGYNYSPPEKPSGLYDLPEPPKPAPTTKKPPPPIIHDPEGSNQKPSQIKLPTTPKPMKMGKMGMPYDFQYGINDPDSGTQFTREEVHNGDMMRGEYRVLLPDGRMQVVTYFDEGNGFNAEVKYL